MYFKMICMSQMKNKAFIVQVFVHLYACDKLRRTVQSMSCICTVYLSVTRMLLWVCVSCKLFVYPHMQDEEKSALVCIYVTPSSLGCLYSQEVCVVTTVCLQDVFAFPVQACVHYTHAHTLSALVQEAVSVQLHHTAVFALIVSCYAMMSSTGAFL